MTIQHRDFLSVLSKAKDNGRYITGLCPFHNDSNPSLLVFSDGWWRCLGCSKNGRWESLWNKLKGQNVTISPEVETKWNGPDLMGHSSLEDLTYEAHRDLLRFTSFQWYLKMRGLDDRIETAGLGFMKGWYTIPVRDENDRFLTSVFRSAPHIQEATGMRYWCPSKSPMMYVPDHFLLSQAKYIVVTFGIFDALALSSLRIPAVTSTFGKDSFNSDWLHKYRVPIYVCPDKGEEATAFSLSSEFGWRSLQKNSVILLNYTEGMKDPADYFAEGRKDELHKEILGLI